MKRQILKKFYKFRQKQLQKKFYSHWYLRFGWLETQYTDKSQLNNLFEIHSPQQFTFADAFYAKQDERHFIFFEEVDNLHPVGFLSVIEIFKDGQYSEPKNILKLDYHLSYPCIFQIKNEWFMIPETSANKTIELWRCTDFPLLWTKHSILFNNIEAVDSTPFFYENMWYLFTSTRLECKKFGDRLDIFFTEDILNPQWQPHPQNPVCKGHQQFRMGGKPFLYQNKWVRPSQNSLKRYGGSLELKEIVRLTPTQYQERLFEKILPTWSLEDAGCHTINVQDNFVLLDAIRLTPKSN